MNLFVGIDAGTQGVKVLVYDSAQRKVVSRGAESYDLLPTTVPGRAEQNASTWVQGTKKALQMALKDVDRSKICGLGVSGQQHGLVALDQNGEVLRPAKLWCDVESAQEAEELSNKWNFTIVPGFTAPKLLWLKNNEPEIFDALTTVLLPHDYLNWYLTGEYAMEAGDASGTGLMDIAQRQFDPQRIATIDSKLHDCLPPLLQPDQVVGTVRQPVADELGLPSNCIVSVGGGDNMMSAIGCGAVQEGTLVCSLGTSGTLFGVSSKPILDPSGVVAPFCDSTGQWLPLLCTQNCTLVPEQIRSAFPQYNHTELTELATREAPGCEGINFLPYLTGERTPNWPRATGGLFGLRPGTFQRPGLLYRAAIEGTTFSLLAGYNTMADYGLSAEQILLVGGGSRNPLWRQIVSDAFNVPVRLPLEAESAALGAALQAAAVFEGAKVAEYVAANPPPLADQQIEPQPCQELQDAFKQHVALGWAVSVFP